MPRRTVLCSLVLAVAAAAGAAAPSSAGTTDRGTTDASRPLVDELPQRLRAGWSASYDHAAAHPDDLAHPWIDERTGALVTPAVTQRGEALARAGSGRVDPAVRRVVVRVTRSFAELERLKHAAADLAHRPGPGARIFRTSVDAAANRAVVHADAAPADLLDLVAKSFGRDAVAVQVTPGGRRTTPASRQGDTSPFWGGARVNAPAGACTTAFPWLRNTTHSMIAAGHCAYAGGQVSTPASYMGAVSADYGENWNPAPAGTGTVLLPNQNVYRGDISRIAVTASYASGVRTYVGGVNSADARLITSMHPWRSAVGDTVCTGGATTGELCGWKITATDVDQPNYNTTIRNASVATKPGSCISGGDSGGPVYSYASDGSVVARGVISAGGTTSSGDCVLAFTDVWHVWHAFGGFVNMNVRTLGDQRGPGQQIQQNQQLVSPNGRYIARMQADGNFVIYKANVGAVWSTGTSAGLNAGTYAEMQTDGNFVLYRPGRIPVYASNTAGRTTFMRMQDDCNLVIYTLTGLAVWASKTAGC